MYQILCVHWWTGLNLTLWKDLEVGGWDLEIPSCERIEKPVRKKGPPLIYHASRFSPKIHGHPETTNIGEWFLETGNNVWWKLNHSLSLRGQPLKIWGGGAEEESKMHGFIFSTEMPFENFVLEKGRQIFISISSGPPPRSFLSPKT